MNIFIFRMPLDSLAKTKCKDSEVCCKITMVHLATHQIIKEEPYIVPEVHKSTGKK